MREVVIVSYGRSAVGKAGRGVFSKTRPEYIGSEVLKGVLNKVPNLDKSLIGDLILGCAMPEAEQGMNMGRIIGLLSDLPNTVPAQTINRFCSSGSQAIASAANAIIANQYDVAIAGGVESMTTVPMGGNVISPYQPLTDIDENPYVSMGITAENVAKQYGVTREEQDAFALESHKKAAAAIKGGKFKDEIIPIDIKVQNLDKDGNVVTKTVSIDTDEGVRDGLTIEQLGKLRPVFKMGGTVTAGTASQMSDGAGFVVLMEKNKAEELGIKPLAKFVAFDVYGCAPSVMGIGPMVSIPRVLEKAGITKDDVGVFEINEAFASQAIASIKELGLDMSKINVNGGAISLGHPLGATGAILTSKLIGEMKRRNEKYGVVSMCIGGGMGASTVIELL